MSKLSSPALALGACAVVLTLLIWNPRGGGSPRLDAGVPPGCAFGARPTDGACFPSFSIESSEQERADEGVPPTASGPSDRSTTTPALVISVIEPAQTEICRTIAAGSLKRNPVFGSGEASHVYASYQIAGQNERDVVLPGGAWRSNPLIAGGRYWVYAGCTDLEIAKKVAVNRLAVNHNEPGAHEGQGDPHLFTYLAGTDLGPPPVQRLD